jgi:sugar-specific transcriptional regulator TrmB
MDSALLLKEIGLSNGEVKVYSALLSYGKAQVSKLHERTGIERSNIYGILNKLVERGLVSYIYENKKRFFQLSHPSKIGSYIEEKKQVLEKNQVELDKVLPSLVKQFNSVIPETRAEIYRGTEGVKASWMEQLDYSEIFWIGSGRYVPKKFPTFFAQWNRKRVKKKIPIHNLLKLEMKNEVKKPLELEYARFLPKELSGNPTVIGVYGNKVANWIYGDNLSAFVIEDKDLAESYRKYFKYLWRISKPI